MIRVPAAAARNINSAADVSTDKGEIKNQKQKKNGYFYQDGNAHFSLGETTMILSVSRRTDVPRYYPEWFIKRLKEGYVDVKNPVNPHQISRISLNRDVIDCIVFWTKDPEPMMKYLKDLRDYPYYVQFTITGYGKDIEPALADKETRVIPLFRELAAETDEKRVIWRYDPIFFTPVYTPDFHLKCFEDMARQLRGSTRKVVISLLDDYRKIKHRMSRINLLPAGMINLESFLKNMKEIALENEMELTACAEQELEEKYGIASASCIDKSLVEQITGMEIDVPKDRNQRPGCGCIQSIDVGSYDTCPAGCLYCYASGDARHIKENCGEYDKNASLLCGRLGAEDKITERKVKSFCCGQMNLWGLK